METNFDFGANLKEVIALGEKLCRIKSDYASAIVNYSGSFYYSTLDNPVVSIQIYERGSLEDIFKENLNLSEIEKIRDAFERAEAALTDPLVAYNTQLARINAFAAAINTLKAK